MKDILTYAKENFSSFEQGGISSNEIRYFEYEGKKYVLKTPLMIEDRLSPFWRMMKNVFNFTFQRQNAGLVYSVLKENPHIRVSPFITADESVMIYEFVKGKSWTKDEFPKGKENAYRLGLYVGYNHQINRNNCGILGIEDVTDFFSIALSHMESCINTYWNGDEIIDKKVRLFFENLKKRNYKSSKYALMMADMSADQFLYDGDNISACIDLDAYVIGPVEWELSFLRIQIEDWESFKAGYETYQRMPAFEELSDFFFFLMALNSYENKAEIFISA